MGLKLKVTFADLGPLERKIDSIKDAIGTRESQAIGEEVVDEMKDFISKGVSPIDGNGRFPAYKGASRSKSPNKKAYPYSVQKKYPGKGVRPVNLFLSGDFLSSLKASGQKNGFTIGFSNKLSEKKEQGHREGANDQPERPIIPEGNEELNRSIQKTIRDGVLQFIKDFINKLK